MSQLPLFTLPVKLTGPASKVQNITKENAVSILEAVFSEAGKDLSRKDIMHAINVNIPEQIRGGSCVSTEAFVAYLLFCIGNSRGFSREQVNCYLKALAKHALQCGIRGQDSAGHIELQRNGLNIVYADLVKPVQELQAEQSRALIKHLLNRDREGN